jgi:hypothetical protein
MGGWFICTSTNSGATWTQTSAPHYAWTSLASSTDGTRLVAVANGGVFYTSTNSGDTWASANAPAEYWQAVACSADGTKVVAAANSYIANQRTSGDPICTLQFLIPPSPPLPTPRLNMIRSIGNLSISWLVPSTSFGLQQNSDLSSTNCTDAPGPTTLNFTNLHYETKVPPSNGSSFYRLKHE